MSNGDTSSCTFQVVVTWGDNTSNTYNFPGGPNGAIVATYQHTYSQPGAYTLTYTATVTSGSCSGGTGTNEFTLTGPAAPGCGNGTGSNAVRAPSPDPWGGYEAVSNQACTFTSVTGQWAQPALSCPRHDEGTLETDFWVGLDGAGSETGSRTVEQTGIEAQCVWGLFGYHTQYRAWYEMYPAPPVYTGDNFNNLDPEAGSLVKATVIADGDGQYGLDLAVTTDGTQQSAITEQACANICSDQSAEWVMEKVGPYGLADFKTWDLYDGEATTVANPQEQTVESFGPKRVIMNEDRHYLGVPLGLDGSHFLVAAIKR